MRMATKSLNTYWLPAVVVALFVGHCWAECIDLFSVPITVPEDIKIGTAIANVSSVNSLAIVGTNNGNMYINVLNVTKKTAGHWQIQVHEPLDAEWGIPLQFNFLCGDAINPTPDQYTLILLINDVNEFAPYFEKPDSTVDIPESQQVNTTVYTVTAIDNDITNVTQFDYKIVHGGDRYFEIHRAISGQVILIKSLDYDSGKTHFVLNISATEYPISSGKTNYTTLNIMVQDVDDLPPKFSSPLYNLSIPEGSYTGKTWHNTTPVISAFDQDLQINMTIQFRIDQASESMYGKLFLINETNGQIGVDGHLSAGAYQVLIVAYQTDDPVFRYSTAIVSITATNVNTPPKMSESEYQVNVSEATLPQTIILTISAIDNDGGINSELVFKLDNRANGILTVETDYHTGIIRLDKSLDRENISQYTFEVWAEEELTKEKFSTNKSTVQITVLDENDNSPEFQPTNYTFNITRTDKQGFVVGQVFATDKDAGVNKDLTYGLESPNSNFKIDGQTGKITLKQMFTISEVSAHYFIVSATDGAVVVTDRRTSFALVTVNVLPNNTSPPTFVNSPYTFSVLETTVPGFVVGQVNATDVDGDVVHYTLSANPYLSMNPNSGTITVIRVPDRDTKASPAPSQLNLTTNATDGLYIVPEDVKVNVIYVNEFQPKFLPVHGPVGVLQNASVDDFIVNVTATDDDNGPDGKLTYAILTTMTSALFKINDSTGEITLNCSSCLDSKNYVIYVEVTDGGHPSFHDIMSVQLSVVKTVFNHPHFSEKNYYVSLQENQPAQIILQLLATDLNIPALTLQFSSINPTPHNSLIEVFTNGTVYINGSADAEIQRQYVIDVSVTNGHNDDTAVIVVDIIDQNDNDPVLKFTAATPVSLPENTPIGTFVAQADATDKDVTNNNGFSYFLTEGAEGKFNINVSTGVITLDELLDRRQKSSYNITINVLDHGNPPALGSDVLVVIITDSNTAPYFVDKLNKTVSRYNFSVNEDLSILKAFDQLQAVDPDIGTSGQYHFTLKPESDTFILDKDSGNISLIRSLNYEEQTKYTLIAFVTDNSYEPQSSSATVIINVINVEEPPQWPQHLPTVYITQSTICQGQQVQLHSFSQEVPTASSPGNIDYYLLNLKDIFIINKTSGLLKINKTLTNDSYTLDLSACNNGTNVCSNTTLTVMKKEEDVLAFCPAYYKVEVNESEHLQFVFLDLNTTGSDSTLIYNISEGNDDGKFAIDEHDGKLYIARELDRETTQSYVLIITAEDASTHKGPEAQVIITVLDAPDSPPEFLQASYVGHIMENKNTGSPVRDQLTNRPLIVEATDKDENPQLSYSIDESNDTSNGSFSISSNNEILLAKLIDYETIPVHLNKSYTFQVLVTDGYFTGTATVTVHIDDDNDNPPHFDDPGDQFVNVIEGPTSIRNIANITVTDSDTDTSPVFSLSSVSPAGAATYFHISDSTGSLSVQRELDREVNDKYILNVTVTDGKYTIFKLVTVIVVDLNDNSPQFNETFYLNVTEGDAGIGTNITVVAYDADTAPNAEITYSIISGNDDQHFKFDAVEKNVLKTIKPLDRENAEVITLTIQAIDSGNPPLTGIGKVVVRVLDVNDNPPVFSQDTYYASVSQDAINVSVELMPKLHVTNADPDDCKGFKYELSGIFTPFTIDEHTGALYVSQKIDKNSYIFSITATDNCGKGLSTSAQIIIQITGVSETVPQFLQQNYTFEISKNSTKRQYVGTLQANNDDNGTVLYILDKNYMFDLDPLKGDIQLTGDLESQTTDVYVLNASACNVKLQCDFATVNITVTDKRYKCSLWNTTSLSLSVEENQDPGLIGQISVLDNKASSASDIKYSLNGTDGSEYINISVSGDVNLLKKLKSDKLDINRFSFTVSAEVVGHPYCTLGGALEIKVIGINNNNPEICYLGQCGVSLIEQSIYDESPAGTLVAFISALDNDTGRDGEVTLNLTSQAGGPQDFFSLSNDGIITLLKTTKITDLEKNGNIQNNTINLLLVAKDKGQEPRSTNATVKVKVIAKTPDSQTFTKPKFNMSVKENKAVGTYVGTVTATPGDGLNYSISIPVGILPFEIGLNDGNITTTKPLDREDVGSYLFTVEASGSGQHNIPVYALVSVTVEDVNEPPTFDQPFLTVTANEGENITGLLTLQAHDGDEGSNGLVTYKLLNTSLYSLFALNQTTGVLSIIKPLDRETNPSYDLTIQAVDDGSPSLSATEVVHVIVADINDNAPQFTSLRYECNITRSKPPVKVITVTAKDDDEGINGTIVYFLESELQTFTIDRQSGEIHTITVPTNDVYTLVVSASDEGSPPLSNTTNIIVRVIDNTTSIEPSLSLSTNLLSLFVGMTAGTQLHVSITTRNTYNLAISGGNVEDTFKLENGHLFLTKNLNKKTVYYLNITATSTTGQRLTQEMEIKVESLKFEQQSYSAAVLENGEVPQVILDIDSPAELSGIPVIYSLQNDFDSAFFINKSTGVLSLVKSLDRETSPVYKLNVILSIDKSTALTAGRRKRSIDADQVIVTVVITIDDMDDNVPIFDNLGPEVSLSIPENVNGSYLVTTLKASDPDEGFSGLIRYSILDGNDNHVFSLDPATGELRVVSPERLKDHLTFELTVQATDRNGTGNSSSVHIRISITQDGYLFRLSTPMSISELRDNLPNILNGLSKILGYDLTLEAVTVHEESGNVDPDRSDILFRAHLQDNGGSITNISANQIAAKVAEHQEDIEKLFQPFVAQTQKQDAEALGIVSKSLIGLACFLFVVTLVAVVILCRMWRKQKKYANKNKISVKEEFRLEELRTVEEEKRTNIYSEANEHFEAVTTLSEVVTSTMAVNRNAEADNAQQHLQHVQQSLEPLESESMDFGTSFPSNSYSERSEQELLKDVNSSHQNMEIEDPSTSEVLDNEDGSNEKIPDPDYKDGENEDGNNENTPDPDYKDGENEDGSNENTPDPDYKDGEDEDENNENTPDPDYNKAGENEDGSNENTPDPDYNKAGGNENEELNNAAQNSENENEMDLKQTPTPAALTSLQNSISHSPFSQSSIGNKTSSSYFNGVIPHKSSPNLSEKEHQSTSNNIINNSGDPEIKSGKTVAFSFINETFIVDNEEDVDQDSMTDALTHF